MKKILFLGDLTDANNYGAVATSESLKNMVVNAFPDISIEYIKHKSMTNPTATSSSINDKTYMILKKCIIKILPCKILDIFKERFFYNRKIDFVPYRFDLYEEYYRKMDNNLMFRYEKELLNWCDVLFINGEGTVVHGIDKWGRYRTAALYWFFMAWIAKVKFNKKVCVVNHIVDPNSSNAVEIIKNVYCLLDDIVVRDPVSVRKLREYGIMKGKYYPDVLFSYKPQDHSWVPSELIKRRIDFSKPYICIGDTSGIKNTYHKVKWDVVKVFSEIIRKLKVITPQIIFIDGFNNRNPDIQKVVKKNGITSLYFDVCNHHDLYYILQKSLIFISGRWHASILSVLANTPVLLWGADSHKTRSLYTILDYDYRFYETSTIPANIDDMIDSVKKILMNRSAIKRQLMIKVEKLSKESYGNIEYLRKVVE